jgi:hypothetical protein
MALLMDEMVTVTNPAGSNGLACAIGFDRQDALFRLHLRFNGSIPAGAVIEKGSTLALSPDSGGLIALRCAETTLTSRDASPDVGPDMLYAIFYLERSQLFLLAFYGTLQLSIDIGGKKWSNPIEDPKTQRAVMEAARTAMHAFSK